MSIRQQVWSHRGSSQATCAMVSALMLGVISTSAMAADADTDADTIAWKFTASSYRSSDSNNAIDLNLRGNLGPHTAWIGFYRDDDAARQARAGYERHVDMPMLRTVLSAQISDGVFVSGSSWSLTCDRGAYFARIARDRYASFTPATQTRLSAGMRF